MRSGHLVAAAICVLAVIGAGAGAWALSEAADEECGTPATAGAPLERLSKAEQARSVEIANRDPAVRGLREKGLVHSTTFPAFMPHPVGRRVAGVQYEFGPGGSRPTDLGPTEWRVLAPVEGWCAVVEGRPTTWQIQRVRASLTRAATVRVQVDLDRARVVEVIASGMDGEAPGDGGERIGPPEPLDGDAAAPAARDSGTVPASAMPSVALLRTDASKPNPDLEDAVWSDLVEIFPLDPPDGLVGDWFRTRDALWDAWNGGVAQLASNKSAELSDITDAWRRLGQDDIAEIFERITARADELQLDGDGVENWPIALGKFDGFDAELGAITRLESVHLGLLRKNRAAFITALGG